MHKPIFAFALTAFMVAALVGRSALAQTNDKSLNAIAQTDGYSVQWLLPDRAVSLSPRSGRACSVPERRCTR